METHPNGGVKSCLSAISVFGSLCLPQSLLLKSIANSLAQPHKNSSACFCGRWQYQTLHNQLAIDLRLIHGRCLVVKTCSAVLQTWHCSLFMVLSSKLSLNAQGAIYIILYESCHTTLDNF